MQEIRQGGREAFPAGCGEVSKGCRPPLHDHWTPALRDRFLTHLSRTGNVRAAAQCCGLSRQSVYKLRRRDPDFAQGWKSALARLRERSRRKLRRLLAAQRRQLVERGLGGEGGGALRRASGDA